MDLVVLAQQCAPAIEQSLVTRLMRRESAFNPYAIGLDGKESLKPQPSSFDEAVEVAERLIKDGQKFSVGIAQIHISNVRSLGLTWRQAFHACTNLNYGQQIFLDYHRRAVAAGFAGDAAIFAALRGYNSGNIHAAISDRYAAAILGTTVPEIKSTVPTLKTRPVSRSSRTVAAEDEYPVWKETATTRSDGQSKDFFEE
jgi:type IV secretion system protein VirB1